MNNRKKLTQADVAFINKNLEKIEGKALKQKKVHERKDREQIEKGKHEPMPVTFAEHAGEEQFTMDEAKQVNKAEDRLDEETEAIKTLEEDDLAETFADEDVRAEAFEMLPNSLKSEVHMRRGKKE